MKDKYQWTDADICIKCEALMPILKGNGLRYILCKDCIKKLWDNLKHWKRNGLYAEKRGIK